MKRARELPDLGADEYNARCFADYQQPWVYIQDYSASALQLAVDDTLVDDEVKIAGTCVSVSYWNYGYQTVYISQPLTCAAVTRRRLECFRPHQLSDDSGCATGRTCCLSGQRPATLGTWKCGVVG